MKKNIRRPIGYIMAIIYLFRAHPTATSFCIGTVVVLFGETIRFVSAGTLKKYKGVVSRNGIYAFSRNPLYIGSFLLGAGFCIIGRDVLFSVLFVLVFIPVYRSVIKREEAFLLSNYGDVYLDYFRTVPRIFPKRIDFRLILREMSSAKSFNNKEGKTLVGIVSVLVFLIVKTIFGHGLPG
ncbi:isoprenylcysteine carboxylmethyltransferase family protein [bacterium]|nr:isoprenylcysteine carboxylmethyltransferase family protein [bacterium]